MGSGATVLFAIAVLLSCSLIATMMASHHAAEQFMDSPVTLSTPMGALCAALMKDEYTAKLVAKPEVKPEVKPAAKPPAPAARPIA